MLRFSRKTDYALLLLAALASQWRASAPVPFVSVRSLAERHRLPYRFASAIVTDLAHAGILESLEGVRGGCRLSRDPNNISLADVVQSTDGDWALVSCLDHAKHFVCAQKGTCPARRGVPAVQRILREALARHTLADLILSAR